MAFQIQSLAYVRWAFQIPNLSLREMGLSSSELGPTVRQSREFSTSTEREKRLQFPQPWNAAERKTKQPKIQELF
ncbi:hypothetical protein SDJN02_24902, partial [Cucurbita argyrosperma subsp. argyrosperma]